METHRAPLFDNAKYLAIVLVACAHFWEPYRADSRTALALYLFVYAFHMPAFIVTSGYFTRTSVLDQPRVRRLVAGVLVPYLGFEVAYTLFRRWADQDPDYPVNAVDPLFLNWFLLALFLWRLTAPLWSTVRWPLAIALGLSVLVSVTPDVGPALDLQRVLQFLPFFVLGTRLEARHFAKLRERRVRWAAAPVVAGACAVAYWAAPRMSPVWLYHRQSAQELGVSTAAGVAMSLALFGCSLLLTACFFAWVPGRRTWFTTLGTGTLYGYLLHGFVVKGSVYWGWYEHPWVAGPVGMVTVTGVAALLVTLLCTQPVRRVFRPVVEPRLEWLFRPGAPESHAERTRPAAGRRPGAVSEAASRVSS